MLPRRSVMAAALVMQASLCPRAAPAAERDCPGSVVRAAPGVREHWPDVIESIESELSARAHLDSCVEIDLRIDESAVITVSVTLPDGRYASRNVPSRDDLIPTLQGLLLVPVPGPSGPSPDPPAAASPQSVAAPHRDALPENALHEPSRSEPGELPATTAARSLGIEVSLLTGARIGDGQLSLGAGALSMIELNGWLIGFEGRADAYRAMSGGDAETVLELAVLAGRRFDLGSVALDLSAGPGLAMKGSSSSEGEMVYVSERGAETPPPMPPQIAPSDPWPGPVPRFLLGARVAFGPRSLLRTFVGIDGEIGPALGSTEPSSARLPGYSVGLSLGATIGTP